MTISHALAARLDRGSQGRRAAILRIEEDTDGDGADVAVTLGWDGEEIRGTAAGGPDDARRARIVGEATLQAIEEITAETDGFRLIDTTLASAGGVDIAIVVVEDPGLVGHPLIGAAVICEGNRNLAAARATLDAVNRRLGFDD
jgi:hypothetical protein